MRKTAKQLAEELGVSATTVSLALRGSGSISQATRERVIAAARSAGMAIPEAARDAERKIERNYALVCSSRVEQLPTSLYPNPFVLGIIRDMGNACVRSGARLMTVFGLPENLNTALFDGYFIFGGYFMDSEWRYTGMKNCRKPVVVLDQKIPGLHSAAFDQQSSVRQLADFVGEHAKRPFYLYIDQISAKFIRNYRTLRYLLQERQVPLETMECNLDGRIGADDIDGQWALVRGCAEKLAARDTLPDMLICSNDCFAGMLQVELKKRGIAAGAFGRPGVIPLVGFDDIPYVPEAGLFTTFRSDTAVLSDAAVRLMEELLDKPAAYVRHIEVEMEMLVR